MIHWLTMINHYFPNGIALKWGYGVPQSSNPPNTDWNHHLSILLLYFLRVKSCSKKDGIEFPYFFIQLPRKKIPMIFPSYSQRIPIPIWCQGEKHKQPRLTLWFHQTLENPKKNMNCPWKALDLMKYAAFYHILPPRWMTPEESFHHNSPEVSESLSWR